MTDAASQTEGPGPEGSADLPPEPPPPRSGAARRLSRAVLIVTAVLFVWHIFADQLTPFTSGGHVQVFFVPVASQVNGYIVDVPVDLNDRVSEGDIIARINPRPYELAVRNAEAQLDVVGQNLRAGMAAVESAEGVLAVARAKLENASRNLRRVQAIRAENPGAISQVDLDAYIASRDSERAQVVRAEADVQRAREQLGIEGANNPAVRAAVAALETTRFNLEMTTIRAPRDGVVVDLRLTEGQFANPGQPLATLIVEKDTWIRASMRENNLVYIRPGHRAELVLDALPGKVFEGRVTSIGEGVSQGEVPRGELPDESRTEGSFTAPQRFPVVLRLDETPPIRLRAGSKTSVIVYTGDHPFMNAIAWLRIRFSSYVAYLN